MRGRDRERRKVIILVSDGVDARNNTYNYDQTLALLLSSDVSVYAIGTDAALLRRGASPLSRYARATGGDTYFVNNVAALSRAYAQVAEEARHQYTLAYAPAGTDRTKNYHSIEVRVRRPGTRGAFTRWLLSRSHFPEIGASRAELSLDMESYGPYRKKGSAFRVKFARSALEIPRGEASRREAMRGKAEETARTSQLSLPVIQGGTLGASRLFCSRFISTGEGRTASRSASSPASLVTDRDSWAGHRKRNSQVLAEEARPRGKFARANIRGHFLDRAAHFLQLACPRVQRRRTGCSAGCNRSAGRASTSSTSRAARA